MKQEFILSQVPAKPTVVVNGEPVEWYFADIPVWPTNRLIRFIHRRILKRPPLHYEKSKSVVTLKSAPPAGSVVMTAYTVEM